MCSDDNNMSVNVSDDNNMSVNVILILQVLGILNKAVIQDIPDAKKVGASRLRSKVLSLYGAITAKVRVHFIRIDLFYYYYLDSI